MRGIDGSGHSDDGEEQAATSGEAPPWRRLTAFILVGASIVGAIGVAMTQASIHAIQNVDFCLEATARTDLGGLVVNTTSEPLVVMMLAKAGGRTPLMDGTAAPGDGAWLTTRGYVDGRGCGTCNGLPLVAIAAPNGGVLDRLDRGVLCGDHYTWIVPGTVSTEARQALLPRLGIEDTPSRPPHPFGAPP